PENPLKLLLLHGVGLTWATWRQVVPALAPQTDCVAIDLLGHGRSSAPRAADVTVAGQTAVLDALFDALGWRQVVVVGHSMGGGVALGAALQQPARVRALVLVGSIGYPQRVPPFFWPFHLPGTAELLSLLVRAGLPLGLNRYLSRYYGYDPIASADFLETYRAPQVTRAFARAVRGLVPSKFGRFAAFFPQIHTPTLIVHGERDDIVPLHVPRRLHETLPNNQLVWIRGGHHIPQETHPVQVARAMGDFLRRLESGADGERPRHHDGH
ncbi:MAG: alpha/beta hydrolase, partial [Armatimonadetes bacterium]|nr:alpha/beta hydrolase [Armatimonadota bacterium]